VLDILELTGGSDDPDVFHEAALKYEAPNSQSVNTWGHKMGPNNQNERSEDYIMQWQDNELVTVFPTEVAVSEPKHTSPFGQ
jgi:branched-chain amino acid transport system substrate-binding protein